MKLNPVRQYMWPSNILTFKGIQPDLTTSRVATIIYIPIKDIISRLKSTRRRANEA